MFTDKELALIEHTVEACECWSEVKWEKSSDDTRLVFTLNPIVTRTYDGCTEIYAENLDEFIHEVQDKYERFDPDYEATFWIGPDGHGKNGAPYRIRDILDEFEELNKAYEELALAFARLR